MRDVAAWQPSKFVRTGDTWVPSRNRKAVHAASRLTGHRQASAYSRMLRSYASGTLLDLGCGRVPLFGMYRHLVSRVVCVDWPQTPHTIQHVDVIADLDKPLGLASNAFDTVVLTDVLEHLPHPDRLWAELARVMRPGAHLLVGVPFAYWLHEEPYDYHRYTEHRLRLFCEEHDFFVEELTPYGGSRDAIIDAIFKRLARRRGGGRLAGLLTPLALKVGRQGVDAKTSFPLGYALVARKL